MKYIHVYILFLVFAFLPSCGENQTNAPKDDITKGHKSESQPRENSAGSLAVKLAETSKVPVSMVRNVKQARNGDILIASFLGVFRYDGTSFTNISTEISSPRFSSFWDVLEDRKGNLWFGTRDSGVYHYNGKSFQHFTTKDGLASNMALHIYEDRAGNIWFGASRYDGKSFRNFTTKDGFPSNSIRLLLEDKTGKLWFGAQGENMFVYDGKTFTVLKNKDGKAFNNVWSIIEDKKGNIWFGDVDGLWRYDTSAPLSASPSASLRASSRTFTKVSQSGAYGIIEDKKGNIWTTGAVNPNGNVWSLFRYDAKSLYNKKPTVTEITRASYFIIGLLEANDGSIWFSPPGGPSRYDGKTITEFKSGTGQE
jgi:ligand-binding sensor domain-containing protein